MEHLMNQHGVLVRPNKHNYNIGKKNIFVIETGCYKGKWYAGHEYFHGTKLRGSSSPIVPKVDKAHNTEKEAVDYQLQKIVEFYDIEEAFKYLNQEPLF